MKLLEEEELSENSREFLGKIRDQMEKNDFLMQSMVKNCQGLKQEFFRSVKKIKNFMNSQEGSFPRLLLVDYYMDFKQKAYDEKEQDAFIESMELGKQQTLFLQLILVCQFRF